MRVCVRARACVCVCACVRVCVCVCVCVCVGQVETDQTPGPRNLTASWWLQNQNWYIWRPSIHALLLFFISFYSVKLKWSFRGSSISLRAAGCFLFTYLDKHRLGVLGRPLGPHVIKDKLDNENESEDTPPHPQKADAQAASASVMGEEKVFVCLFVFRKVISKSCTCIRPVHSQADKLSFLLPARFY